MIWNWQRSVWLNFCEVIMNKHVGSSFDDFLEEEGLLEEAEAVAVKRVLAWQLSQAMEARNMTKTELAERMATSRASVNRLLDPGNASVSLQTMTKAAHALGKSLEIQIA